MVDRDSLFISYRDWRGEPRGPHKAGQSWEGRGDCIDCRQCVAVCPTGIDIRNGAQLECIQCALCIDACNEIMDKIGRPRSLISYDTVRHLESAGQDMAPVDFRRPRVLIYATAMAVVGLIMLTALLVRPELEVSVLHDRNPIYVKLSDGGVRNGYTVKILNKAYEPRDFTLAVQGLPGATLSVIGQEKQAKPIITVPADGLQAVRAYVALDKPAVATLDGAASEFSFVVTGLDGVSSADHRALFQGPER
jgi:cytochrome c oxidase accessory protein FixG